MKYESLIQALKDFSEAASLLTTEWDNTDTDGDLLTTKYPFEKSFDDVVHDINQWVNQSIKDLNNA